LVTVTDDIVHIEFRDQGHPYNPLLEKNPDFTLPTERKQPGGLGIFMVKQIMDTVTYRRDGDINILTISKEVS
jgi:anti-sigma regulatory factor (Ser/Thr protein kinase)